MFSVALLLLLAAGCVKCETLTQPASVTVQPGQRLTITCQVSYSVSRYVTTWIRQPAGKGLEWMSRDRNVKDSLKNKFSISLDSSSNTVTLNGQNVQPEDTAVYYCARAEYTSWLGTSYDWTFHYWGKGTMVTVSSASTTPVKPTVFPLKQCGSGTGDTITLGCLATGFTPSSLTYTWTKGGTGLTDFIQYPPVQKNNLYTGISQIRVKRQDWDQMQSFQCVASNSAGNGQADFQKQIDIFTTPTLTLLASSDEGTGTSLACHVKDFSPEGHEIKWRKNEKEIEKDVVTVKTGTRNDENGTKLYSAASFLEVPPSEYSDADEYVCEFQGIGNSTFVRKSLVHAPCNEPCPPTPGANVAVKIIEPILEDIFSKQKGTVKCQVNIIIPGVTEIRWETQNKKAVHGSNPWVSKDKKTGLVEVDLPITYEEWNRGDKFYCIVEHTELLEAVKEPYQRSNGGRTQRPSVYMLPPLEQTRDNRVTLTCYVKDFYPQDVYVSWLVDDERANSDFDFHTTKPVGSKGSYSVYGQLSLSLEQWKDNDVVYSCVVYHESLANTTRALVRSVGHRSSQQTNMVNLNINIPETSKAQ